jgi:hypothetical protein
MLIYAVYAVVVVWWGAMVFVFVTDLLKRNIIKKKLKNKKKASGLLQYNVMRFCYEDYTWEKIKFEDIRIGDRVRLFNPVSGILVRDFLAVSLPYGSVYIDYSIYYSTDVPDRYPLESLIFEKPDCKE